MSEELCGDYRHITFLPTNCPETFYKYREWSIIDSDSSEIPKRIPKRHHQNILKENKIWFASASSLNDPFDCDIPLRYDSFSDEEMRPIIEACIRHRWPGLTEGQILKKVEIVHREKNWKNPQNLHYNKTASNYAVFSTSASRDSILMWSLYSAAHTGFCVGFDTCKFEECCSMLPDCSGMQVPLLLHWITYCEEWPELIPKDISDEQFLSGLITKKAQVWGFEEELRLTAVGSEGPFPGYIPPTVYREVILGCAMREEDKQEIRSVLTQSMPHVRLLQARKKERSFALVFDDIGLT